MKKLLFAFLILILGLACSEMSESTIQNPEYSLSGNWDIAAEEEIRQETADLDIYLHQLKLITRGSLDMEVADFQKARTALDDLVKAYKGFIVEEKAGRPDEMMETEVVIKLLPERFYQFLKSVEPLALHVDGRTIETQDVTREYTDLEARLKAKEDVANRYKEILKTAKDVKEVLIVEGKLGTVLEEIESMKGRIRYYNEQIGLSTVKVRMYQYLPVNDVAKAGFFSELGHAFTFGWNDILDGILGIASNWHLWLFWIGLFFFIYQWFGLGAWIKKIGSK